MALLNVPIDVPWKLISVSPDMMANKFCPPENIPMQWRPSIAIFAYEPKIEDLPEELCNQRITYLKVTCSISGYEYSPADIARLRDSHGRSLTEEQIGEIINDYLACYGVLLRVSVFTQSSGDQTIKELVPFHIDFSQYRPESRLPSNPYTINQVEFHDPQTDSNLEIVDIYPQPRDGKGELLLKNPLSVIIPSSLNVVGVEAKVTMTDANGQINMTAYGQGNRVIGSDKTSQNINRQPHLLRIQRKNNDNNILKVTIEGENLGSPASMLEFVFYKLGERKPGVRDLPHIVDFEPKRRDLYQAGTEENEILTASKSEINTAKSQVSTHSTETGISIGGQLGGIAGGAFGFSVQKPSDITASLTNKWGDTSQDSTTTTQDSSRERRERFATSTTLNQMYNLLTGYHIGTNRAVFLMLPRPHTLQPTDKRTFVRGLRIIEGIQDFFIIVSRPYDPINTESSRNLYVEAHLETGHFSEKVAEPKTEYDLSYEDFEIQKWAAQNFESGAFSSTYVVKEGFVVDYDAKAEDAKARGINVDSAEEKKEPDKYHRAVAQISKEIYNEKKDEEAQQNVPIALPDGNERYNIEKGFGFKVANYSYRAENTTTVKVEGVCQTTGGTSAGGFLGRYRVFTRSEKPKHDVLDSRFIVFSQCLCAGLESSQSTEGCINPIDLPTGLSQNCHSAIRESPMKINAGAFVTDGLTTARTFKSDIGTSDRSLFAPNSEPRQHQPPFNVTSDIGNNAAFSVEKGANDGRYEATKELLNKVKESLTNSQRFVVIQDIQLTDTDYFKDALMKVLPTAFLDKNIGKVRHLPENVIKSCGFDCKVREALEMDLMTFARKTGLDINSAIKARRQLLGLKVNIGRKDTPPRKGMTQRTIKSKRHTRSKL